MPDSYSTKEARGYQGVKTVSSVNGAGKIDRYMQKNKTTPPTLITINSKWISAFNGSHKTIKTLEGNTGSKI